jgi:hypothetical protein
LARKIFFSFHYERDAWRAGQVRNCNTLPCEDQVGFIDAVDWQSIKTHGDQAIRRWIAEQLIGTTVTAVLIGAETFSREWVQHELLESWNRGNGVVGIRIHNIKDSDKRIDSIGANPLDGFELPDGRLLSAACMTYDWVQDDGRNNLGMWADEAAGIRAEFAADADVRYITGSEKSAGELKAAAAAAGAVALAGFDAAVLRETPPPQARSSSFTPRAPWCPDNVTRRR